MLKRPWSLLLCPLLWGWSQPSADGATMIYKDVMVSAEAPRLNNFQFGYMEYRITVVNKSTDKSHRVTVSIPKSPHNSSGDYIRQVTRSAEVEPGASVNLSLLYPNNPHLYGTGMGVHIDGKEEEEPVQVNVISSSSYGYGYRYSSGSSAIQPQLLMSRNVGSLFQDQIQMSARIPPPRTTTPAPPPAPPGGGMRPRPAIAPTTSSVYINYQFLRSEVPASTWSTSWLGYSCYAGIVMTALDLAEATPAVKSALWQYVECGGALVVLGKGEVPSSWKRVEKKDGGFTVYTPGFGQCLTNDQPSQAWDTTTWGRFASLWGTQGEVAWERIQSLVVANNNFQVVKDIGIPVKGLFVLMLIFSVVIGPINLLILAKLKRRLWMLWTIPIISLITCVSVFGYMLMLEGWEGHLGADGLTILDESSHRATTVGWMGFYSPVAPSDGLHFGYDTQVVPQVMSEYYNRGSGKARTIDWTHEQQLATGWMTARIPAHFVVRKSEIRRERVTIKKGKDGAWTIVNGLGAPIKQFRFAAEDNKIHSAADIPAGGQATLTATAETLTAVPMDNLRPFVLGDNWMKDLKDLPARSREFLRPGWYVATLEDAPFMEEGLRKAKTRARQSVVVGVRETKGASSDES